MGGARRQPNEGDNLHAWRLGREQEDSQPTDSHADSGSESRADRQTGLPKAFLFFRRGLPPTTGGELAEEMAEAAAIAAEPADDLRDVPAQVSALLGEGRPIQGVAITLMAVERAHDDERIGLRDELMLIAAELALRCGYWCLARELAEEASSSVYLPESLQTLGGIYVVRALLARGRTRMARSVLSTLPRTGVPDDIRACVLETDGHVSWEEGRLRDAVKHMQAALDSLPSAEAGLRAEWGSCLGYCLAKVGHPESAVESARRARVGVRSLSNRLVLFEVLWNVGRTYTRCGIVDRAERDLRHALILAREMEVPAAAFRARLALLELAQAVGDDEREKQLKAALTRSGARIRLDAPARRVFERLRSRP